MISLPFLEFGIRQDSEASQYRIESILEAESDAPRDAGPGSESGDALDFLVPSQLAW